MKIMKIMNTNKFKKKYKSNLKTYLTKSKNTNLFDLIFCSFEATIYKKLLKCVS